VSWEEVYAWRHALRGGKSPTLRISRYVLEHYPDFAVIHFLDELRVAQQIRRRPGERLVVVQSGDRVTLEEWPITTKSKPDSLPEG
jgi:hypothetical protein